MESVGDHYIAGDGRANENFALTAIHHVFHEDHNVQLLNLEGQILKQQAADGTHVYGNQFEVKVNDTVTPTNSHIGTTGGHYIATGGVIALDANNHFFVTDAADTLTPGARFLFASDGITHIDATGNYTDAAYAFDGDIAHAQAILDADITGSDQTYTDATGMHTVAVQQAAEFLLGAKDASGNLLQVGAGTFNNIDLWLGGLAEKHVYGGFLGPTFNAIFEDQMERLMDGDRFYYLYRLDLALPVTTAQSGDRH
jgi:hypothetical protein